MKSLHRIFDYPKWLALFLGALSATGFAPLGLWPVTLICFALLIHLIATAPGKWSAFNRGWLFGVAHFVIGLNWIATAFTFQAAMPAWLGYLAVVLLSLYLAVYPALATLGAWWIANLAQNRHSRAGGYDDARASWVLILAFAGMWIITEWLRSWVFTGFIWNPLSASLVPAHFFTHFSQWIGTYGLSGIVVIFSGLLVLIFSNAAGNVVIKKKYANPLLVALVIMVFSGVTYAITMGSHTDGSGSTPITVVQPNITQDNKWDPDVRARNFEKLARLTPADAANKPRLILWPEAAIPDYLESGYPDRFYYPQTAKSNRARLTALMTPGDVMLLGALKLNIGEGGQVKGASNSVLSIDSEGGLGGSYDKSHLVPYGEYLPMKPLLSALGLSQLAPSEFGFTPGPGPRNIDLDSYGVAGIQVCYEIIFSGQVVDPDNRPGFIFNPSNDAWFGAWGPPQHLAQARLRAAEEGLPVIRSTPTGISAIINADGKIVDSIPMGVAGRMDNFIPAAHAPTLFSRYGNILPLGFAFILLLSAVAIGLRRR